MIYHILKDGTITKDITGKVVKMTEAKEVYDLMSHISNRRVTRKKEVKRVG